MNIEICAAKNENVAEISSLTAELGYTANETHTKEWLGYLLDSENHGVFVAINSGKSVCGWVVVEKRISLETGFKAEISGLIVGEKYRRLGIGQQLITAAVRWARDAKLTKLVVRSNIQREESHVFYQCIGFKFKKTAHNYELSL